MFYVLLLLSFFCLYLNGGEGSEPRQQMHSDCVNELVYRLETLQERSDEQEDSIDWLAYILLSGRSDRHPELRSVPCIKRFGSTLWLHIHNKNNAEIRSSVNLSELLQQEGSLKSSLDKPLDEEGYIVKTFLERMNLARPHIDN